MALKGMGVGNRFWAESLSRIPIWDFQSQTGNGFSASVLAASISSMRIKQTECDIWLASELQIEFQSKPGPSRRNQELRRSWDLLDDLKTMDVRYG